jgi:hypothetical protein
MRLLVVEDDISIQHFGIFAILIGILLLTGFIELVRHGAELSWNP